MLWKKFSSGVKSSSGVIFTGPCWYFGFVAKTAKASYTVQVYDALAASGTLMEDYVTDATREIDGHSHAHPVLCRNGIYLSISGGSVIVYYLPQVEG